VRLASRLQQLAPQPGLFASESVASSRWSRVGVQPLFGQKAASVAGDNTFMALPIGESLCEARARRGIELSDVEQATKIRVKYLRAMEEERWEVLPGAAYARGFLRTYGDFLGLDGNALVEEYGHRHEPVEDRYPEDEPLLLKAPGPGRPRPRFSGAVLAGLAIAALAGVIAVLGLTGGDGGERADGEGGGAPKASTAEPPPRPSEVSLELTSAGTVWVCLIDERGRELVDGVTLAPGERQGPFRARALKVTLGNGEVRLEVDGRAIQVPQLAEPLGYQITPQAVRELDPAARPTCV
jgi:cytoskeleton protein RodZ